MLKVFDSLVQLPLAKFLLFPYGYLVAVTLGAAFFLFTITLHSALSKKRFLHILGQQTAPLFATCVCLTLCIPFISILFTHTTIRSIFTNTTEITLLIASLAISVCFAFMATRFKNWSKQPLPQSVIFLLLAFAIIALLATNLTLMSVFFTPTVDDAFAQPTSAFITILFDIILAFTTPTANVLLSTFSLLIFSFLLCTSLAQMWLMLRRHIDNFGRDYYTYSLRITSVYGSIGACALTLVYLIHLMREKSMVAYFPQPNLPAILLSNAHFFAFLAAIFWIFSACSKNPLRIKIVPLIANILLIWAIFTQLTLWVI